MSKQYELEEGLIESYVLGLTSHSDTLMMDELAMQHAEVRERITNFSLELEQKAMQDAVAPPLTLRPLIMASIDYIDRLTQGEKPASPPLLNEYSTVEDYAEWLDRPDMVLPHDFHLIHTKLIGHTPQATTAIVWLAQMAPDEVHHNEHERFLIVEGTCTITINTTDHKLVPGDYLAIPLHADHHVVVTSAMPCKIILQRVAA